MASIPNTLNSNQASLSTGATKAKAAIDNAVDAVINGDVTQNIDKALLQLDKEINKAMALIPSIACTSALLQFPMGKTTSLTDPRGFAPGISAASAGVVGQIRNYEAEYAQFKEKLLTLAMGLKQLIDDTVKAAETVQEAFDTVKKVVGIVQGAFGGTPISKEEIIDKLCAFSKADLNAIPADSVLRKIDTFKQINESFKDVTFAVTAVGGGFALPHGGNGGGSASATGNAKFTPEKGKGGDNIKLDSKKYKTTQLSKYFKKQLKDAKVQGKLKDLKFDGEHVTWTYENAGFANNGNDFAHISMIWAAEDELIVGDFDAIKPSSGFTRKGVENIRGGYIEGKQPQPGQSVWFVVSSSDGSTRTSISEPVTWT